MNIILDYKYIPMSYPPVKNKYYYCDGYDGLIEAICDITDVNAYIQSKRHDFDKDELRIIKECADRHKDFIITNQTDTELNYEYDGYDFSLVKPLNNIYIYRSKNGVIDRVYLIIGKHQPHHYLSEYLPCINFNYANGHLYKNIKCFNER